MDRFDIFKLNRSLWLVQLEQNNLKKAIKCYKNYCIKLKFLSFFCKKAKEELLLVKKLFEKKLTDLGYKYLSENDNENAVCIFNAVFLENKNNIEGIKGYIECLDKIEQFDLSETLLNHLRQIANEDAETCRFMSKVYEVHENFEKSAAYMEKYINLKKTDVSPEDYNILGCIYDKYYSQVTHNKKELYKSLENFEIASDMSQGTRLYAKNATIMAGKGNKADIGRKHWQRLLSANVMNNDDKYDYAAFCLKNEDFAGWHKYFDYRFAKENNATFFPEISGRRWDGTEDISDCTLLVHCEQGFGDTFLVWGYMPRILKFAKNVIFVTQNETYRLLKDNDLGVEVLPRDDIDLEHLEFDYYLPSMSIPIILKLDRSNIGVGEGYLKPSRELIDEYKQKYFDNTKFKIGVSFSGAEAGNKTRDISVEEFLPLDELENVEIYNMTKGLEDKEFEIFKNHKVVNVANEVKDFADTAAAIANCDVILTADNCILNLAAAVGTKTFAIFNWSYEFRWFDLSGEDVVWYTCVKPFVCDEMDNWQSAVLPAIKEIEKLKTDNIN